MKSRLLLVVLVALGLLIYDGVFVVDETEQVVKTQFGRPVGTPIVEPGLYFKIPLVHKANYFPKNILAWDGDPGQIPTLDKTYIWVDTFARWQIKDPLKFLQTVNNVTNALARLDDILDSAVRNLVTSYPLIESVRNSNRKMEMEEEKTKAEMEEPNKEVEIGRNKITEMVYQQAYPKLEQYGIHLVDVKFKRINYVEEVQKSVYARMIAERKQMAEKFRSEGIGEANKIQGAKERDLKEIMSEAYRRAQEIKGKADAEAARIYAEAYNQAPEFYSFLKGLEVMKNATGKDTKLILSTRSEVFRFLRSQGTNNKE